MEKMNGDMLEMILNSPQSRISERLAKYMIYQVSMDGYESFNDHVYSVGDII